MCEYCGCQDIVSIGELTREHDAVVAEIAEVRALLRDHDVDGAAKAARRIAEILGPHTAVEERGLFPWMRQEFPEHIDALEREHRVIEDALAEAGDGTPTDPSWPTRLLSALELLRDHILKEQDGVFLPPCRCSTPRAGSSSRPCGRAPARRSATTAPPVAGTRAHPPTRTLAPLAPLAPLAATDPRW